jgi:hypothetical protein
MGISHRKDDIRVFIQRAARDRAALADALATVEQFNSRVAAGRRGTTSAAMVAKRFVQSRPERV